LNSHSLSATPRRAALACLLTIALAPTTAGAANGDTMYVSDELVITFRTQPSTRGEILHNLTTGTSMVILDMDSQEEWAQVRLQNGREGWVRKQYLTPEPAPRHKLEAANRDAAQLSRTVADLRQQLQGVQSARTEAEESSESLESQVSRLQQELAEIKRVSANAIETAAENRRITDLNARLRDELDELVSQRDMLTENSQQRWLMIGGGLVLLGLILGIIIKARPRRSAWT
jgi:SH3 domain protein